MWEVEFTDEFEKWWNSLTGDEQESIAVSVRLLQERGPSLGHPHSSAIRGSKISSLRELRTMHRGRPLRTLYAFDPRRAAVLLIGGEKTGDPQWYRRHVPRAERIYRQHLREIGHRER
ncbi:type II toxin-antitoxin system RelE/ParE family toxin [Candidatus Sumerlaeota bacterium]|nr:type II toxin-antitoxin system RelE/ParE family toxin [Candidatus Sumerlaeota bacterium]